MASLQHLYRDILPCRRCGKDGKIVTESANKWVKYYACCTDYSCPQTAGGLDSWIATRDAWNKQEEV